jgi:hypothetical protein
MPKYKVLKPAHINGRFCPGKGEIVELAKAPAPGTGKHLELVDEPKPAPAKRVRPSRAASKAAAPAATKPDADSFD